MVATSSFLLAASSILPLALGAPVTRNFARSLAERASFAGYKVYGGDGSTSAGWPAQSDWLSFDDLWSANQELISSSCATWNVPNNDETETGDIKTALQSVGSKTSIPPAFLLAIMMQESKGCVRVPTTNYGVRNPGLFQDFNGDASCNDGGVQTPCPSDTITKMVEQGAGIGLQFGMQQAIQQAQCSDVSKFYKATRIFNSGSLPAGGNLGQGVATHCYASDIANRLMGWVDGASGCQEASIGSLTGSAGTTTGSGSGDDNTPTPTATSTPAASSAPAASSTPAAAPSAAPSAAAPSAAPSSSSNTTTTGGSTTGGSATSTKFSGASNNCKSWYDVKAGDSCESTGVSFDTLRQLNSGLDDKCSNLWAGYAYCTAA